MTLIRKPNLTRVDDVYQMLIDAHVGRSDAQSARLNAKLILILLNHVGDSATIAEAIALAGLDVSTVPD